MRRRCHRTFHARGKSMRAEHGPILSGQEDRSNLHIQLPQIHPFMYFCRPAHSNVIKPYGFYRLFYKFFFKFIVRTWIQFSVNHIHSTFLISRIEIIDFFHFILQTICVLSLLYQSSFLLISHSFLSNSKL